MPEWLIEWSDRLLFQFKAFCLTIYTFIKDAFLWFMEQLFDLVILILDGLGDLFSGLDVTQYMNGIPSEVGWVMNQCGLGIAMGMIGTAITIRLILQLIPLVRLGS